MTPIKAGLDQLNSNMINEQISELRSIGITDASSLEIALAQSVIINTFGG
jgi:hypothetical protein